MRSEDWYCLQLAPDSTPPPVRRRRLLYRIRLPGLSAPARPRCAVLLMPGVRTPSIAIDISRYEPVSHRARYD